MARRSKTIGALGLILSLVFVIYSLLNLKWDVFSQSIVSLNYAWVAASVSVLFITMILRSARWHVITGLPRVNWVDVWEAASVGYMGTAIFPARAGEVMRVIHLQRLPNASTGLAVGSSIIDRAIEGLALCALIALALFVMVPSRQVQQTLLVMACILLVLTALIVLFIYKGSSFSALSSRLPRFGVIGSLLRRWCSEAHSELQNLREPRRLVVLLALQVVTSVLDVLACWLLFIAFGWSLPMSAALVVLVSLAVVSSLPSTPGYVGVYQVAAMTALHGFNIESSAALAYGTILQVSNFALFVVVGLWAYRRSMAGQTATRH